MFIERDEPFVCDNCGRNVAKLVYTCRDHCPNCLYSKHLDINPGDRASNCGGVLKPVGVENNSKKRYTIIYKCEKCGAVRKNVMAQDDNFDLLLEIVKNNSYNNFLK